MSGPGKVELDLSIRLERDDDIPAFGAFLRCEPPHEDNHVIVLNVGACMWPGRDLACSEERKRLVVETLMHEFGHALEAHFRLPVNEEAIEKACQEWDGFRKAILTDQQHGPELPKG